jgi:hypothetical protein
VKQNTFISRRAAFCSLAVSPLLATALPRATASSADAQLLALGRKFDTLAAEIDHSIEHAPDINMDALEKFSHVTAEILTIQAKTIEGLSVKARAACWALLGDLDPIDDSTLDKSMALSIVRDLIRLQHPHLEHPGAMRKLVEGATNGVSR